MIIIVVMIIFIAMILIVPMPAMIVMPPLVRVVVFVDASASGTQQADAKTQQTGQNQEFTQHIVSSAL
jgi:hypothetical protein